MKQPFIFVCSIFNVCCLTSMLYADGPGTTTAFSPVPLDGIIGAQSTAYNSQNNQIFFTWLSGASEVNYVIFNANGTVAVSQNTLAAGASNSPFVCYNSTDNEYLVVWVTGGTSLQFSIVDDNGNVVTGPIALDISPGFIINGDSTCCYNSGNNQYCITWTAQDPGTLISAAYFALIDANGTVIKGETQIPAVSGQVTADATNSFATYNATDNEYLFTWLSTDGVLNSTAFAIYSAAGTMIVSSRVIPQAPGESTSSHPIFSCYNSIHNQYFITWVSGGLAYYAIYSNRGVEIISATEIATAASINQPIVCSYNVRNDQYFISWNDSDAQVLCAIFDADGAVVSSEIEIPALIGGEPQSIVFNSFNVENNTYFITWYAAGNVDAYYNIFTTTALIAPPSNLRGTHSLNRFANYGEYVNQLAWNASSSANTAFYKIYRANQLMVTLPSLVNSYSAHNQPSTATTYSVQATNSYGDSSSLVSITL